MNKSASQRYYLVNGIQGLKLNSKAGSSPGSKSRPSSSKTTTSSKTSSRPASRLSTTSRPVRKESDNNVPESNDDADVIIHVYDENRNAKRDFYCRKGLLQTEMSYFASHLLELKSDYEIDVHCDMEVFEWLINHIMGKSMVLDVESVVSILISSSFLQMKDLESQCLEFIHKNINQVIQVPIDLRCIPTKTVKSLSKLFTTLDLAEINDPKAKIEDQLYYHNLSGLISRLVKCNLCSKVLCFDFYSDMNCDRGDVQMDKFGNIILKHHLDESFDPNEFIVALYLSCKSWKYVYWRIWGIQTKFECRECKRIYPASEFLKCKKHISDPIYNSEGLEGRGVYPCCNKLILKFMPFGGNHGCHYFPHMPISTCSKAYEVFVKVSKFISWKSSFEDQEPTKITATEIIIPEKKLFYKWNFLARHDSIPGSNTDKNRENISSTQKQFDQRRKGINANFVIIDEQKLKEWKKQILQQRHNISN